MAVAQCAFERLSLIAKTDVLRIALETGQNANARISYGKFEGTGERFEKNQSCCRRLRVFAHVVSNFAHSAHQASNHTGRESSSKRRFVCLHTKCLPSQGIGFAAGTVEYARAFITIGRAAITAVCNRAE